MKHAADTQLPSELLQAAASRDGLIAVVVGAGCSVKSPTSSVIATLGAAGFGRYRNSRGGRVRLNCRTRTRGGRMASLSPTVSSAKAHARILRICHDGRGCGLHRHAIPADIPVTRSASHRYSARLKYLVTEPDVRSVLGLAAGAA